jgi:hypothetical protein
MAYERNADTPETADVLEAGNYYRYYAGSIDGAIENDDAVRDGCAIIVSQKLSSYRLNVFAERMWNSVAETLHDSQGPKSKWPK